MSASKKSTAKSSKKVVRPASKAPSALKKSQAKKVVLNTAPAKNPLRKGASAKPAPIKVAMKKAPAKTSSKTPAKKSVSKAVSAAPKKGAVGSAKKIAPSTSKKSTPAVRDTPSRAKAGVKTPAKAPIKPVASSAPPRSAAVPSRPPSSKPVKKPALPPSDGPASRGSVEDRAAGDRKIAHAVFRPTTEQDKKITVQKPQSPVNHAPDLLEKDEGADPGFLENNDVFDETDLAQHLQLVEQAEISRRARELNRPQTHPDFDGVHCIECEIDIPALRLSAGRIRCVDCQEEVEAEERRTQNLIKGRG